MILKKVLISGFLLVSLQVCVALANAAASAAGKEEPKAALEVYHLDSEHLNLEFKIKHLVFSKITGHFKKVSGSFEYNEKTGLVKDVFIEIETASIDTNSEKRDNHLRSPDFFDTATYPKMTYTVASCEVAHKKPTLCKGELSLHGVKKVVPLTVTAVAKTPNPYAKSSLAFSLTGTLNRKDFGIVWNKTLETGGLTLGEDVEIEIEAEAMMKEPTSEAPENQEHKEHNEKVKS